MTAYLDGTLDLKLVCDGLSFPEGPIWMRDGSIILVEIRAARLTRVTADGKRETIAELGGGPNGAAIGPDGAVYVCNNGGMSFIDLPDGAVVPVGAAEGHSGGSIQRVDLATGDVKTLYQSCEGRRLNSPNDLVFDRAGGFWFTDLGRSFPDHHEIGHVYYAEPDGSSIRHVRGNLHSPNGIGLSPDGSRLYVAETFTGRIWCHDVVSPGEIAKTDNMWLPGEVLGPLPGYQLLDSLAVDAAGNICAATLIRGGITRFTPDGASATHFAVPDLATTNICFGGDGMGEAWITASNSGRLYRTRWPEAGLPLAFSA